MLVVMDNHATPDQIERVVRVIEEMGYHARPMPGGQRMAVGLVGNDGRVDGSGIEGQPITWEQDGVQYVAVSSGIGGVYELFAGDERLAKVPAGGSLWVFALAK